MQPSNVPASSSSRATKPMHMAEFAAFDEEGLLRYFMHDTGKSRDQTKQDFTTQWGGIKAFMDFCRKEKAYDDARRLGQACCPPWSESSSRAHVARFIISLI